MSATLSFRGMVLSQEARPAYKNEPASHNVTFSVVGSSEPLTINSPVAVDPKYLRVDLDWVASGVTMRVIKFTRQNGEKDAFLKVSCSSLSGTKSQ